MSKCKECGIKFTPQYSSLEPCCGDFECRSSYAIKVAKKNREKLLKEDDKAWKERKSKAKIELYPKKTKSYLQDEINKLARMIDAKLEYLCIDCGKPYGKQIDACHFHNKSTHGEITYNLHNLHSGRSDCNFYSSEHKVGYYKGLVSRYGKEYADYVNEKLEPPINGKLTQVEIAEKLKIVRQLIRDFDTFIIINGADARFLFNKIIGIY